MASDFKSQLLPPLEAVGIVPNGPNPWDLQVHNEKFWDRLLAEGSLGLGESYMDGWWDVADMADPDKAEDVAFSLTKHDFQVVPRVKDGGALRTFAEAAMAPISETAHTADEEAFSRNPVCVGLVVQHDHDLRTRFF